MLTHEDVLGASAFRLPPMTPFCKSSASDEVLKNIGRSAGSSSPRNTRDISVETILTGPETTQRKEDTSLRPKEISSEGHGSCLESLPLEPLGENAIEGSVKIHFVISEEFHLPTPANRLEGKKNLQQLSEPSLPEQILRYAQHVKTTGKLLEAGGLEIMLWKQPGAVAVLSGNWETTFVELRFLLTLHHGSVVSISDSLAKNINFFWIKKGCSISDWLLANKSGSDHVNTLLEGRNKGLVRVGLPAVADWRVFYYSRSKQRNKLDALVSFYITVGNHVPFYLHCPVPNGLGSGRPETVWVVVGLP